MSLNFELIIVELNLKKSRILKNYKTEAKDILLLRNLFSKIKLLDIQF